MPNFILKIRNMHNDETPFWGCDQLTRVVPPAGWEQEKAGSARRSAKNNVGNLSRFRKSCGMLARNGKRRSKPLHSNVSLKPPRSLWTRRFLLKHLQNLWRNFFAKCRVGNVPNDWSKIRQVSGRKRAKCRDEVAENCTVDGVAKIW